LREGVNQGVKPLTTALIDSRVESTPRCLFLANHSAGRVAFMVLRCASTQMAAWRRGLRAYFVWLVANALAGAAFAPLAPPLFGFDARIIVEGLYAGTVFGVAQWLALRPFLSNAWIWVPVTIIASPLAWSCGMVIGVYTVAIGGWLGAGVSATAQSGVLLWSLRRSQLMFGLFWVAAAVIGGAVFYVFFLVALSSGAHPPAFELIVAGGIGYALVTGLVVALIAMLEAGRSMRVSVDTELE
jgi:hypothetical protein